MTTREKLKEKYINSFRKYNNMFNFKEKDLIAVKKKKEIIFYEIFKIVPPQIKYINTTTVYAGRLVCNPKKKIIIKENTYKIESIVYEGGGWIYFNNREMKNIEKISSIEGYIKNYQLNVILQKI